MSLGGLGGLYYPLGGSLSVVSVAISPLAISIPLGGTSQLSLIATFIDSSTVDVTGSAVWSGTNSAAVNVSGSGLATALQAGRSVITATYSGLTAQSAVTGIIIVNHVQGAIARLLEQFRNLPL